MRLSRLTRIPPVTAWGELFERAAERHGDRPVITDRPADVDPAWTEQGDYATWAARIRQASGWLKAAGVERGDRVVIMKGNHADVAALSCGTSRVGAIPVHLAWTHAPDVTKTLLARLDRPVLVIDRARIASCDLGPDDLERLTKRTIVVDDPDPAPPAISLDALRDAPIPASTPRRPDEVMIITHTSGTTGVPKLVMHSTETVHALARPEVLPWPILRLRASDVVMFADPFFHARLTTGLIAATAIGPKLLLMSSPEPANARRMLVEHRPTIVETPPNAWLTWEPLADDPARPFRDVRLFVNTFDAIHTRTIRRLLDASDRRFPLWSQSWGQSEAGIVTVGLYPRVAVRPGRKAVAQTVGRPLPILTKLRAVAPDTGQPLKTGEIGLLEVEQPGRCLGYVGEMDRWEEKRNNGWWNTGDLGSINRAGMVRLVDREVDRIPTGSGIELEDILLDRLPTTTEVVVLAVAGQDPLPVLATQDDVPIAPEAWAAATRDLPPLQDPVHLPWEEIPRTATWKVRRAMLREQVAPGAQAIGTGRWT